MALAPRKANLAKLAAGTKIFVSYDMGVTFEKVPGFTAIGDIGEMADTQETTTLEDTERTYIASLGTPANKQLVGNLTPNDGAQAKFIEAAKTKQTVMFRVELPTYPKTIGINTLALLGFQVNGPTAENVLQFTIGAQASGKTIWTTNTDVDIQSLVLSSLTNSVEVSKTLQLTVSTLPENATVTANQIKYEALNPDTATVSNSGLITGVAAGDFGVRAYDSVTNIETMWFGRCVAAAAAPSITAKTGLTATAGTAKTFTFAELFTATNSTASDYTLALVSPVTGASISGSSLALTASIAAGTVSVKATHKTDSSKTATANVTVS